MVLMNSPYNSLEQNIHFIAEQTNTKHICVTKGSHGAVLYYNDTMYYNSGYKIEVADTVGAGDTVGAIVVEAMIEKGILNLTGDTLKAVLHRAAVAAGITCSRKGAQPPYKHELKGI